MDDLQIKFECPECRNRTTATFMDGDDHLGSESLLQCDNCDAEFYVELIGLSND